MTPLTWTTERPTQPGWYWCRNRVKGTGPECVRVAPTDDPQWGGAMVFCTEEGPPFGIWDMGDNTEWAGPIPEPTP